MPHRIEPAGHRSDGGHIVESEPYDEACILLAQGLPGGDGFAVGIASCHPPAQPELEEAAEQRHHRYTQGSQHCYAAGDQGSGSQR